MVMLSQWFRCQDVGIHEQLQSIDSGEGREAAATLTDLAEMPRLNSRAGIAN